MTSVSSNSRADDLPFFHSKQNQEMTTPTTEKSQAIAINRRKQPLLDDYSQRESPTFLHCWDDEQHEMQCCCGSQHEDSMNERKARKSSYDYTTWRMYHRIVDYRRNNRVPALTCSESTATEGHEYDSISGSSSCYSAYNSPAEVQPWIFDELYGSNWQRNSKEKNLPSFPVFSKPGEKFNSEDEHCQSPPAYEGEMIFDLEL